MPGLAVWLVAGFVLEGEVGLGLGFCVVLAFFARGWEGRVEGS